MQRKSVKYTVLVSMFLVITIFFQSCWVHKSSIVVKPSHINELKSGKVIVATIEYPKKASVEDKQEIDRQNALAVEIIKKNWNFCPIADVMPLEEARKFMREHDGYFILTLEDFHTHFMADKGTGGGGAYNYSKTVSLYLSGINFSGGHCLRYYLPFTHLDQLVNSLSVQLSVLAVQQMVNEIASGELKNSLHFNSLYKSRSEIFKTQTLLIPEFLIHEKLSINEIKKHYPYKFEICDNKRVEEAILNRLDGYVYPVITSISAAKDFDRRFCIYSSTTGICCASVGYYSYSKGNVAYFNSKVYSEDLKMKPRDWKWICHQLK